MSEYAEAIEALERLKARAHELEERCSKLEGNEARARVVVIQLEGVMRRITVRLNVSEQLEVSAPVIALQNLFLDKRPRVACVGKLPPLLRLVGSEEEAADLLSEPTLGDGGRSA